MTKRNMMPMMSWSKVKKRMQWRWVLLLLV
jgi:hypothetical protein